MVAAVQSVEDTRRIVHGGPPAGHYDFAPAQEMQHDTSPHRAPIGGAEQRVETASLVLCYSRMLFFQRRTLRLRLPGPRGTIVEIGSWKETSTTWLAEGAGAGSGVRVFAIDPHEP